MVECSETHITAKNLARRVTGRGCALKITIRDQEQKQTFFTKAGS